MNDMTEPLIKLENLSLRRNGEALLENIDWEIRPGESWAVVGPNGCGKTILMQVIQGRLPYSGGNLVFTDMDLKAGISNVSFEMHQQIMADEHRLSYSRDYAGQAGDGATVLDMLEDTKKTFGSEADLENFIDITGIRPILHSSVVHLSNGEMRKFLITRALLRPHRMLVLDEPYDGLDAETRPKMTDFFMRLSGLDTIIILVTHHIDEISDNISHVLCLDKGRVLLSGKREEVLAGLKELSKVNEKVPSGLGLDRAVPCIENAQNVSDEPVIVMKNVKIAYGDKKILDNLSWTVKRNENWGIVGPNGAGKSTLLKLISGDHLQAYSNDIWLFGVKRGSGESIWDIKARQGFLSPEFQNSYRQHIKAVEVVLSGFFDSVGLYRWVNDEQKKTALDWLSFIGMSDLADKSFRLLSYGEKRMILLARALVKSPKMLILDEPCQGLDSENRKRLISTVSHVSKSTGIQVLYVSHRKDEFPDCMTHLIEFRKRDGQGHYDYFLEEF